MSSSGEEDSTAGGILANLWRLIEAVMDDSEPSLEALGISLKAFFLLEQVVGHPFPAELARRMHLPPPTVTYLVKQLEEKGYLERRAEPGDLRRFRLVQTASGIQAIRQGYVSLGNIFGERLECLEPGEVAVFDRMVKRLANGRIDKA